ncbi:AI-2E family transporter [Paenibacillus sp. JX-17]|uniref:AI-2E family transporter n=1 Tax=Paenibacillus lacisoli TaxID=3064525 RepID=A0ABT9C7K9_9BACL|nr:AI-2E family transporter [Paenibacillus sp. JX-17]MDO7904885.1 AI-2E family transporter [Paenibacillus sp. JX-17]
MEKFKAFIMQNDMIRRLLVLLIIIAILFGLRGMLNLMLLLFLVTYVMDRLQDFITRQLNRWFRVDYRVVVVLLYVFIVTFLTVGISNYMPKVITQITGLTNELLSFINSEPNDKFSKYVSEGLANFDIQSYAKHGLDYLLKLGKWIEVILFVIILSLFFLLQKKAIQTFTDKFSTSKIGWFYDELKYFGQKFVSSFGKVLEVQLLIAVFNTVFTTIALWILGFPYLFALSILIMLLSLVPVAGVIISLIPLCLIGLQIGGIKMVLYVIIIIIVIHALESYLLNPKLMSSKTQLPIFYTFIILIFSQHYLGVWGLIIGIPIFMFVLDILDVNKVNNRGILPPEEK